MICTKNDKDSDIKVVDILKSDGLVVIPTDTVYGFSTLVDLKSSSSNFGEKKIIKVKGRDENKPLIQLISKPEDIYNYTDKIIPDYLMSKWPGALTIIVPIKRDNPFYKSYSTVAFRCPGDEWLRTIIENCGCPIYSTSVNRSGKPVLEKISEIKKEFENDVDLIVDDGDKLNSLPSTLISLLDEEVKVLRQGSVII